jgi:hypothetical protein
MLWISNFSQGWMLLRCAMTNFCDLEKLPVALRIFTVLNVLGQFKSI